MKFLKWFGLVPSLAFATNITSSMQYMNDVEIGSDEPDTEALWTKIAGSVNWLIDNVNVAVNKVVSSSCGTFTSSASAYTDITNLSVPIVTTGRPVLLALQSSSGSGGTKSYMRFFVDDVATPAGAYLAFNRGGSNIAEYWLTGSSSGEVLVPPPWFIDFPAAGSYTYKARFQGDAAGGPESFTMHNMVLVAYEMRAL